MRWSFCDMSKILGMFEFSPSAESLYKSIQTFSALPARMNLHLRVIIMFLNEFNCGSKHDIIFICYQNTDSIESHWKRR